MFKFNYCTDKIIMNLKKKQKKAEKKNIKLKFDMHNLSEIEFNKHNGYLNMKEIYE